MEDKASEAAPLILMAIMLIITICLAPNIPDDNDEDK